MTVEPDYHPNPPDTNVQIEPFTKTNFKTPTSRDLWSDLLDRIAAAKSEAEWRSVMDNDTDRKAAVIHVTNYNRERWLRRVSEYDLSFRDIRYSKPYDGFSHKFFPTDETDPERITYSVLAVNDDIADKFEEAETEMGGAERHDTVGQLLGFPSCCRDFFNDVWVNQGVKDPMYEITCNSDSADVVCGDRTTLKVEDPNPGANILWRYFGWSFITHHPCSWDCTESVEIARDRYRVMCEAGYDEAADALYEWLDEPHVWSGYHALATVKNQHIIGNTHTSSYWTDKTIYWKHEPPAGGGIFDADPEKDRPDTKHAGNVTF